jgi:hypothetical protein
MVWIQRDRLSHEGFEADALEVTPRAVHCTPMRFTVEESTHGDG